jgi:hypothetical protein
MCFIDTQIGRLINSITNGGLLGAASSFTIPSNRSRVGLKILCSNPTSILFGPTDSGLAASAQPTLAGGLPISLSLLTDGLLVQKAFTLFNNSGGSLAVLWIEATAPEWLLSLNLDKLKQMYGVSPGG